MNTLARIYTIGHSTRSLEEFVRLLTLNGIEQLVDIRTYPGSRKYPHFNREALETELPATGIAYRHMPTLGGRRKAVKDSINSGWRNPAFQGYADYMQTPEFQDALSELVRLAQVHIMVIMCAEAVPWRCHRSLVGDALVARHIEVLDIISSTSVKPHRLTPWAEVNGDRLIYPKQLSLAAEPG